MALFPTFGARVMPALSNNSDALLQLGAGLLGGRTAQEQVAGGIGGFAQARQQTQQRNKTLEFLRQQNPDLAAAVESGALSGGDAYKLFYQQKLEAQKPKPLSFQSLDDGTYGNFNESTGVFTPLGKASKPMSGTALDIETRKAAAVELGLSPDSPAYQPYILTGKFPREDQQSLTTTDKKAILESDDAISTNKSAIGLLDQALAINDKANSGWFAGARATAGNNLPDWLVPDKLSSPESSAATTEYDNLVQQGALSQLKTIFGGNPTEGERAILLELQASSNKPPPIRKKILERAKELANNRLMLNQQRADQLRGGDFYKPQGGMSNKGGRTSSGIQFSIEGQ